MSLKFSNQYKVQKIIPVFTIFLQTYFCEFNQKKRRKKPSNAQGDSPAEFAFS